MVLRTREGVHTLESFEPLRDDSENDNGLWELVSNTKPVRKRLCYTSETSQTIARLKNYKTTCSKGPLLTVGRRHRSSKPEFSLKKFVHNAEPAWSWTQIQQTCSSSGIFAQAVVRPSVEFRKIRSKYSSRAGKSGH